MSTVVLGILLAACAISMLIERSGVRTVLALDFKGDVKRETRWLAQYGQGACTLVVAALVWQIDSRGVPRALAILAGVFGTSIAAMIAKRLLSRVRPGREDAGRFLGPHWSHANFRESFPSSHSACAIALSVILAGFYPAGTMVFWVLAIVCAALRYVMDAHWPSDVLGGVALGYAAGHLVLRAAGV
jgi:membrane-associated phospholipid phosphatase